MGDSASSAAGGAGRTTPYTLVFADGGFEERLDAILQEAADRGLDDSDPERLIMLTEAGRLLRDLLPEDAHPGAVVDLGALVFHAAHFKRAGLHSYVLDATACRMLLEETRPPAAEDAKPPAPAGYLQLPRNVIWARVGEDAPWEPADGLFWVLPDGGGFRVAPLSGLHALLVLGLRADRPGFSVAAVAVGRDEEECWSAVQARPEGGDFANQLPGGELAGLHTLTNLAEVLKL